MKRKSFIAIWVCMFALFVFSSNVFAVPSDLVTIKSIAGGDNHTLYLTESGKVYAAGNNEFGQLGSGDTQMREIAVRIDHSKEIRKISAGGNQSAFVDAANDLYVTGANSEGQLGLGDTINKSSFMKVSGLPPIVDVAVGRDHILALDMDGNVWASGSNDAGQLGLGNFSSRLNFTKLSSLNGVASIFAGNKISAAILTDHTVMMWGSNWAGQLGLGDDVTRNSPTASPIHNVTKIAFGYYSTFFISSGTTYAAGYNANGQLGDGSTSYARTPVPVGDFMDAASGSVHSIAVKRDGTVVGTGSNFYGQINQSSPWGSTNWTLFNNIHNAKAVISGESYSAILTSDGKVIGSGWNGYGQLAIGTNLTNGSFSATIKGSAQSISMGLNHVSEINKMGQLFNWGSNLVGQLGNGGVYVQSPQMISSVPGTLKKVVSGNSHTLVMTDNNGAIELYGTGNNAFGQLSDGTTNSKYSFGRIGVGLPNIKDIAAGDNASYVLDQSGNVWSSGDNAKGQLGLGDFTSRSTFVQMPSLSGIQAISANGATFIALKSDGTVYTVGEGVKGQLGNGTNTNSNTPVQVNGITDAVKIAAGYEHNLVLKANGKVVAFGLNNYGQLGDGTNDNKNVPVMVSGIGKAQDIFAGYLNSGAIDQSGNTMLWGRNVYGQLGNNSFASSNIPLNVNVPNVKAIVFGLNQTGLINASGDVLFAGWNGYGQFGDGATVSSNEPVSIKYDKPSISYSTNTVQETATNDGTIAGALTVTLTGDEFNDTVTNDVYVGNLPTGITYTVTKDSASKLTLQFAGQVVQHKAADSVTNAYVTIRKSGLVHTPLEDITAGLFSIPYLDPNLPSVVSDVTATYGGSTATIRWTKSPYATSYELKRNGTTIYTGTDTEYTDSGLVQGTTYTYTVVPVNSNGKGEEKSISFVMDSKYPDSPGHLTAVPMSSVTMSVYWDAVPTATNYILKRDNVVIYTGSATSFTDTIVGGKRYEYSVEAQNAYGVGNASTLTVTTDANTDTDTNESEAPLSPQNLTGRLNGNDVLLEWEASGKAKLYKIKQNGIEIAQVTSPTYLVQGLANNSSYTFSVIASNNYGDSAASEIVVPTISTISVINATYGGSTATIRWTKSPYATSYELKRNGTTIFTGTDTEYTDSGLVEGTTYTYSVVPVNSSGKGEEKSVSFVMDSKYPGSPGHLTAVQMSSVTMSVYWDVVPTATSYILKRDNVVIYTGSATSFTDTIADGKRYEYSVAAQNAYGVGNASTLTVTTDTYEAPLPPQNFTGQPQKNSVLLTWNAAAGATKYKIKQNGKEIAQVTSLHYLVDQLNSNTLYTFTVTASNNYGESAPTEIILSTLSMNSNNDDSQSGRKSKRKSESESSGQDNNGSKGSDPGSGNESKLGQGNKESKGGDQSGSIIQHTFEDIYDPQWATEAIIKLYNLKIINGYSAKEFKPKKNITRAEYVKVLVLALGEPAAVEQDKTPDFEDVTNPDWYYNYIKLARRMGLAKGDAYNLFYPNKEITRKEAIAILVRALRYRESIPKSEHPENQLNKFKDTASLRDWSSDEIALSIEKHLIEGYEDRTLRLDNQINRAEVCVLVTRLLDRLHGK